MKIIDEILPKVKAEVRLDKDNKTLWIKTDTLEGYGRIIIEDGANWCRIFYEECGECAHNDAEQTEPTISKMEQVDKDIIMKVIETIDDYIDGKDDYVKRIADRKTEPQTNADQHVQHVGSVETMSCEECKHWIFTSQWGWFCPLKGQDECHYEPIEDEPQTEDTCEGCVNETDCPWK